LLYNRRRYRAIEGGDMKKMVRRVVMIVFAGVFGAAGAGGLASAASLSVTVPLSGAQQVPPVQTSGSGTADLKFDPSTRAVTWSITYSGLSSPVTMAHFHGPARAGKNGPVVIWLTKKGSPVASPITGKATLTPHQAQQFMAGEWYINVHTQDHPAGEIRGQVTPPKS
jgi:CHRD domain